MLCLSIGSSWYDTIWPLSTRGQDFFVHKRTGFRKAVLFFFAIEINSIACNNNDQVSPVSYVDTFLLFIIIVISSQPSSSGYEYIVVVENE
jgi:hypothetical protein